MDGSQDPSGRDSLLVRCLGPADFVAKPGPVALSAGRKGLALLCVLAAEPGHRVARDRLAALLWGGRFEEQARQSLRQTLSALRRDFEALSPDALRIERDFVALDAVRIDIEAFEAALARRDFSAAVALWRGDFAEGLEIDSVPFAEWRDGVRARLRPAALAAFEGLARAATDDAEILSAAERMLAIDPYNEVAIGLALPPVARRQGASAAAARYDAFAEALRREKGRAPLPETQAVYAATVGGAPGAAPQADPAPARPPASGPSWRALAAGIVALAAIGFSGYAFLRDEDQAESTVAPVAGFIEPAQLRWPFRFVVSEPRALDREQATAKAQETLAGDLRNALAVMPGAALVAPPAQGDFAVDSDIRSGEGGRLAINLRLTERATGRVLWADTLAGVERYAAGFPEQRAVPIDTAVARAYAALLVEMDRRRPQTPAAAPEVAEAVRQGWLALRGGANREKVDQSDAAFRRALELDPESPDARIGMAHSHAMYLLNGWSERRAEDAATAFRLVGETIERSARQPVAFFVQGLVHKSQRDYARGLAALRVTLQIQPAHAASYAQSAHMHLLSGDADRALEMAELGVLLGPEANALDRALLYAGMARFLVGDYPAAVRHLERTFAINRTFADVYAWYAAALYRGGQPDAARDVYRQMRTRWPTHRVDHHVLISHSPQRMERFTTAIADLEARAEIEPARPVTAN